MARLNGPLDITGRLGDMVVYRLPGLNKPVVRMIGKVSKDKRKNSPGFVRTRENSAEFGRVSTAIGWLRSVLKSQTAMKKMYCIKQLRHVLTTIEMMDTVSDRGYRAVLISKGAYLLNGFYLTPATPFDSVVLNPVRSTVSKDTLSAQLNIPALIPGVNFMPGNNVGMYMLVATLVIVPDFHLDDKKNVPNKGDANNWPVAVAETAWYPLILGSPEIQLVLDCQNKPPDATFSLMLTIGICFGTMIGVNNVIASKNNGAAMILDMA